MPIKLPDSQQVGISNSTRRALMNRPQAEALQMPTMHYSPQAAANISLLAGKVQQQAIRDTYEQGEAKAANLMQEARGYAQLAQVGEDLATKAAARYEQKEIEKAELEAQEAYRALQLGSQEKLYNQQDGIYTTRQGLYAQGVSKEFDSDLQRRITDTTSKLSERAQARFLSLSANHRMSATQSLGTYEAKQLMAAKEASLKAQVETAVSDALLNPSPENIGAQLGNVEKSLRTLHAGLPEDAIQGQLRGIRTQIFSPIIQHLSETDIMQAQAMLDRTSGMIDGGTAATLQERLRKGQDQWATEELERALDAGADNPQAVAQFFDQHVAGQRFREQAGVRATEGPANATIRALTEEYTGVIDYGFGKKNITNADGTPSSGIDCSGWVCAATNEAMGKKYLGGSSHDILRQIHKDTGQVWTKEQIAAGQVRPGMVIALDTGNKSWDKGRWKKGDPLPEGVNIDHVAVVYAKEDGSMHVSESRGGQGVSSTPLKDWVAHHNKPGRDMWAVDPLLAGKKAAAAPDMRSTMNPALAKKRDDFVRQAHMNGVMKSLTYDHQAPAIQTLQEKQPIFDDWRARPDYWQQALGLDGFLKVDNMMQAQETTLRRRSAEEQSALGSQHKDAVFELARNGRIADAMNVLDKSPYISGEQKYNLQEKLAKSTEESAPGATGPYLGQVYGRDAWSQQDARAMKDQIIADGSLSWKDKEHLIGKLESRTDKTGGMGREGGINLTASDLQDNAKRLLGYDGKLNDKEKTRLDGFMSVYVAELETREAEAGRRFTNQERMDLLRETAAAEVKRTATSWWTGKQYEEPVGKAWELHLEMDPAERIERERLFRQQSGRSPTLQELMQSTTRGGVD